MKGKGAIMADNMRVYEDLKKMVEDEITNITKKGDLDDKCLEWLDKLVDIAKDVDTIFAMHDYIEDDGGYSNRAYYPRYYNDDMPMHGNSYRNRDSMGRYSRNSYNNYRGNGYSREGNMRDRLEQMMSEATTQQERDAINDALNRLM